MDQAKENRCTEVDEFQQFTRERADRKYKRKNKYDTDRNKKKRQIAQSKLTCRGGYVSDNGKYLKQPKNSKWETYYKRYGNRRVRRYKDYLNGNDYRRVFDLWYTLY